MAISRGEFRAAQECIKAGGMWDLVNHRCVPKETAPPMASNANTGIFGGRPAFPNGGRYTLPFPRSGGGTAVSRSVAGDVVREVGRIGIGVLEDYLRARLIPGGSGPTTTTESQVPGNLVPQPEASFQCPDGSWSVFGRCMDLIPGGTVSGAGVSLNTGEPINGRFGAGQVPRKESRDTRRCARGMVLGVDGVCYDKGAISNRERFWPRGRRPLLTGGDMRAISRATSAANRMRAKNKDLVKLGLLPKSKSAARHGRGCQCDSCIRISAARGS